MSIYTFVISSMIIILIPGTGVIYTVSEGLTRGKAAGVIAAVGCTLGIIPHLLVSILLSSFILRLGSQLYDVIRLIGAGYLIFLGIGMLLSKSNSEIHKVKKEEKPLNTIVHGILINLLNPKLTLFFFSFLPQYVSGTSSNYLLNSFLYGLLFMLLTLIVFLLYGVFAGAMRNFAIKFPGVINNLQKLFGVVFITFAISLAADC